MENDVVVELESFREKLSEEEIERRRKERMNERKRKNMVRWGYNYVFEELRLNMKLKGNVEEKERRRVERVMEEFLNNMMEDWVEVENIDLFVENEEGEKLEVN